MTAFIIEHQCPQCGAPAELEETDRLFTCGFCRVSSYLKVPDFFRYTLPHKAPEGKELIYFPYWRFKGMLFSCLKRSIENRFLDLSHQAIRSPYFPQNIGFRGQTQKLRFAVSDNQASLIRPNIAFDEILAKWSEQYSTGLPKPILHQEYIGESFSLIYAPFYLDAGIVDAVLNQRVPGSQAAEIDKSHFQIDTQRHMIQFLSTLCPQCGWDLTGERDALALGCDNCDTVWQEKGGKLEQLEVACIPGEDQDAIYLPFWRIQADISHLQLETYADLIKVANLPKVVQSGWDQIPFYFWNPAFKVRPQSYLTLATLVTLNQPTGHFEPGRPKGRFHGVTLPLQEAAETMKLNLAGFLRPVERRPALIPHIEIRPRHFCLIYLPFKETHHELIQSDLNIAVNKNMLAHAKNL